MHRCFIKEGNKNIFPWYHLTKNKSRLEFSASCSQCLLSVYFIIINLLLTWRLLWICVCVSVPNKGFHSVFIEQHRYHMGKEQHSLQKSLIEVYKGLSHWLQLTQTTSIIVYQPWTVNGYLQPVWQILGSCFQLLHWLLSANDRHGLFWVQGPGGVCNLRSKLYISIGGKKPITWEI